MAPPDAARPAPAERAGGVLLHFTSLPGGGGIGGLGESALRFLTWLREAGQTVWQVLPFQETGMGASPYGATSSFAGNRLLIDLTARGDDDDLLSGFEAPAAPPSARGRVDYDSVRRWKEESLRRAWTHARSADSTVLRRELDELRQRQAGWLGEWALYAALKDELGGSSWIDWPIELRRRRPAALADARARLADEIEYQIFVQLLFDRQWSRLRRRAAVDGIRLFGDLPIYPALDSADVWANQSLFDLDGEGRPRHVAGVPPDYFSPTGQRWGNPVYRWDRLAEDDFTWWIERLRGVLERVDVLRLDHFRGFAGYWSVPAEAADARGGAWVEGPGAGFFEAVRRRLGAPPLVAEDLGVITPDVEELRRRFDLAGMKVLQFAFDEVDSPHLPHHHEPDTVVYTATHDNDTTRGWFEKAAVDTRERAVEYLGVDPDGVPWSLVRAAWSSVGALAIAPLQDLLGLDGEARMNTPGEATGNWSWRLDGDPPAALAERLRRLTELTGRLPVTEEASPAAAATEERVGDAER